MRFPIRLKILVVLLLLVTGVVSAITFTMAKLFHDDKRAYVREVSSILLNSSADECQSLLESYTERVQAYSRFVVYHRGSEAQRNELLEGLFNDFPALVGLTVWVDGQLLASAFDGNSLENAGLTPGAYRVSRQALPPRLAQLRAGELVVEANTLSPDLPTFSMAFSPFNEREGRVVVAQAVLRLNELQRLVARNPVFEVFLIDAGGTYLAHPELDKVRNGERAAELGQQFRGVGEFGATSTSEYQLNGEWLIGGRARTTVGGVLVGVQIPRSTANLAAREILNRLLIVALGILLAVAVLSPLGARGITRSLERLSRAAREIGRGDFDLRVDVQSNDEIGSLSDSFNTMATELKQRREELEAAHAQLVQSEKMAAFGQLGAGIAHEVKNPLAGILGCAQLALRKVKEEGSLRTNLQLIEKETRRCKTIIENLLKFARQEKAVHEPLEVRPVVDDAVAIVNHQLELNRVHVVKRLDSDLPLVHGNANQLQQVLMNLMINAQQAMGERQGEISVRARRDGDAVVIEVSDPGPGIPDDIKKKIFEPFFTTKPGGKGTGLGLSVTHGIIEDHKGTITLEDAPGGGACFRIRLPVLRDLPKTA